MQTSTWRVREYNSSVRKDPYGQSIIAALWPFEVVVEGKGGTLHVCGKGGAGGDGWCRVHAFEGCARCVNTNTRSNWPGDILIGHSENIKQEVAHPYHENTLTLIRSSRLQRALWASVSQPSYGLIRLLSLSPWTKGLWLYGFGVDVSDRWEKCLIYDSTQGSFTLTGVVNERTIERREYGTWPFNRRSISCIESRGARRNSIIYVGNVMLLSSSYNIDIAGQQRARVL